MGKGSTREGWPLCSVRPMPLGGPAHILLGHCDFLPWIVAIKLAKLNAKLYVIVRPTACSVLGSARARNMADKTLDYMDWQNLSFWPWALIQSGQVYLAAQDRYIGPESSLNNLDAFFGMNYAERMKFNEDRQKAQHEFQLASYNFVSVVGMTVRLLKGLQTKFPQIVPACDAASHLFGEGKALRDMIEHSDEYLEGKGRKQEDFVRHDAPAPGFITDATGTIIHNGTPWLGGRLNVHQALQEAEAIFAVAKTVPRPQSSEIPT